MSKSLEHRVKALEEVKDTQDVHVVIGEDDNYSVDGKTMNKSDYTEWRRTLPSNAEVLEVIIADA